MNLDHITAFLLLAYMCITIFIGVKYQAGSIIKPEYRQDVPQKFFNVLIVSLLILLACISSISLFVDFRGSRIVVGFVFGMMFWNMINVEIKK